MVTLGQPDEEEGEDVPALHSVGAIALALLLVAAGTLALIRRRMRVKPASDGGTRGT